VPNPLDSPPIRSPQAVHSFIASRIQGKDIVEIGTRNGDGMSCFTLHARKATAIEYDKVYCNSLRSASKNISAAHNGRHGFRVTCSDYRAGGVVDADIITWWEQTPLENIPALQHCLAEQEAGRLRDTAEAILLFDPKWRQDMAGFQKLCPLASWSVKIPFNEEALCLSQHADKPARHSSETCDRASGYFLVAGIPIKRMAAFAQISSAESAACQKLHEAGYKKSRNESAWQFVQVNEVAMPPAAVLPPHTLLPYCTTATGRLLQEGGPPPRSLMVIHATVQTLQHARLQAATLAMSAPNELVTGALLLAFNTHAYDDAATTQRLSLYPHGLKSSCRLPANVGYRCGQFISWRLLSAAWATDHYKTIALLEADLYFTDWTFSFLQRQLDLSEALMHLGSMGQWRDAARGTHLFPNTELIVFRPVGPLRGAATPHDTKSVWGRLPGLCDATQTSQSCQTTTLEPIRSHPELCRILGRSRGSCKDIRQGCLTMEHVFALELQYSGVPTSILYEKNLTPETNWWNWSAFSDEPRKKSGWEAPGHMAWGFDAIGMWHSHRPEESYRSYSLLHWPMRRADWSVLFALKGGPLLQYRFWSKFLKFLLAMIAGRLIFVYCCRARRSCY